MVGLRVEGTIEEIKEVHRRLRFAFLVQGGAKIYPSKKEPKKFLRYFRIYLYENLTLLDQLEAAIRDLELLEETTRELSEQNRILKEKLGILRTPRPGDAVLGGQNGNTKTN